MMNIVLYDTSDVTDGQNLIVNCQNLKKSLGCVLKNTATPHATNRMSYINSKQLNIVKTTEMTSIPIFISHYSWRIYNMLTELINTILVKISEVCYGTAIFLKGCGSDHQETRTINLYIVTSFVSTIVSIPIHFP